MRDIDEPSLIRPACCASGTRLPTPQRRTSRDKARQLATRPTGGSTARGKIGIYRDRLHFGQTGHRTCSSLYPEFVGFRSSIYTLQAVRRIWTSSLAPCRRTSSKERSGCVAAWSHTLTHAFLQLGKSSLRCQDLAELPSSLAGVPRYPAAWREREHQHEQRRPRWQRTQAQKPIHSRRSRHDCSHQGQEACSVQECRSSDAFSRQRGQQRT